MSSTTSTGSLKPRRLRQTVSMVSGWINTYRDISTTISTEELSVQRQEYWLQYIEKLYPEHLQAKDTHRFLKAFPNRVIPELEAHHTRELNQKKKEEHKAILNDDLELYLDFLSQKTNDKNIITGFGNIIRRFGMYLSYENASSIWVSQAELALNFHSFADTMTKFLWKAWPVERRYKTRSQQGIISKVIFDELVLFHEKTIKQLVSTHHHEELSQKMNIFIHFYQSTNTSTNQFLYKGILSLFPMSNSEYIHLNLDVAINTLKQLSQDYKGFKVAFSERLDILIHTIYLVMEHTIAYHIKLGDDVSSLVVNINDLHCIILSVYIASGIQDLVPMLYMIRFLYLDHLTIKSKKFLLELALGALLPLDDIAEMEVDDSNAKPTELKTPSLNSSSPLTQATSLKASNPSTPPSTTIPQTSLKTQSMKKVIPSPKVPATPPPPTTPSSTTLKTQSTKVVPSPKVPATPPPTTTPTTQPESPTTQSMKMVIQPPSMPPPPVGSLEKKPRKGFKFPSLSRSPLLKSMSSKKLTPPSPPKTRSPLLKSLSSKTLSVPSPPKTPPPPLASKIVQRPTTPPPVKPTTPSKPMTLSNNEETTKPPPTRLPPPLPKGFQQALIRKKSVLKKSTRGPPLRKPPTAPPASKPSSPPPLPSSPPPSFSSS